MSSGCPICSEPKTGSCKCGSRFGQHTLEDLKAGHGLTCKNGHRWNAAGLVYDPASDKSAQAKTEYAPGIADKAVYGDVTKGLTPGQLATYVLQHHQTKRQPGRPHYDLRLGDVRSNLFSWAIPGAKLPEPGQQKLAPQTQLHTYQYGGFEGPIESGYGAGQVRMADKGQALIRKVTPNSVHFTLAHAKVPTRYALVNIGGRRGKDWLLVNKAMPKTVTGVGDKPRYKLIQAADLDEAVGRAQEVQEKIDGAHGIYDIGEGGQLEAYSVNPRTTGEPIPHTERMGLSDVRVPGEKGTVLRGEMYGTTGGKSVPFSQVSGILNSTIAKAIETQQSKKIKMQNALFDIIQHRGKNVGKLPYAERRKLVEGILGKLPADKFHMPASATAPEEKARLVTDVRTGKNPRTSEGVVLHTDGQIQKFKERQETVGYVTGVFPGTGKRGSTVGGLTFSLQPGGKEMGQVGSGLSDQQLQEIADHPENFVGKPIRLYYQEQFKTGKLRAPTFGGWETDRPELGKESMDKQPVIKLEGGKLRVSSESKQADWRKEMVRSLIAAAPAEAILAGRGLQAGAAGTRANEMIESESPTIIRPMGAPAKTDMVHNLAQMRKYLNRKGVAPDEQKRMLAAAAATLGTVTNATTFRVPTEKGVRSLIAIARGTPAKLYKHEYGHAQQIQGGLHTSRLKDTLGALLLGATLSPKYRREERAWDLAGIPEGDPVRESALATYQRGIQTAVDPIRYGVPAYVGLRYGQAHPEKLRALWTRIKPFLRIVKRGQATNLFQSAYGAYTPGLTSTVSMFQRPENISGLTTQLVNKFTTDVKGKQPVVAWLSDLARRAGRVNEYYSGLPSQERAKSDTMVDAILSGSQAYGKDVPAKHFLNMAGGLPLDLQSNVVAAIEGKK